MDHVQKFNVLEALNLMDQISLHVHQLDNGADQYRIALKMKMLQSKQLHKLCQQQLSQEREHHCHQERLPQLYEQAVDLQQPHRPHTNQFQFIILI